MLPTPDEPKLYLPGLAFTWAMNSFIVVTGIDGCTARNSGAVASAAIGATSFGLYGSLE